MKVWGEEQLQQAGEDSCSPLAGSSKPKEINNQKGEGRQLRRKKSKKRNEGERERESTRGRPNTANHLTIISSPPDHLRPAVAAAAAGEENAENHSHVRFSESHPNDPEKPRSYRRTSLGVPPRRRRSPPELTIAAAGVAPPEPRLDYAADARYASENPIVIVSYAHSNNLGSPELVSGDEAAPPADEASELSPIETRRCRPRNRI